jgi:hypothetical protein
VKYLEKVNPSRMTSTSPSFVATGKPLLVSTACGPSCGTDVEVGGTTTPV